MRRLALLSSFVLAACSGGGDSPPAVDAPAGLDATAADAAAVDAPIALVDARRPDGGPRDGAGPDGILPTGCTLGVQVQNILGGTGVVTSTPAGINCGPDCREEVPCGTQVTLFAVPGLNSTFTGWGVGCTGPGACTVTVNQVFTVVVATFQGMP